MHVSPRIEDFDAVLQHAMHIASDKRITIKHVSRREFLWVLYSKNAPRPNAAKAIVLYPKRDQLEACLRQIWEATHEFEGPPVAGDYRLGGSILHVRYGAFETGPSTQYDHAGNPLILGPDGQWRADIRRVNPESRDAAHLPGIFKEMSAPSARLPGRYQIDSAFVTNAGGGVYRGSEISTGRNIVIKRGIRHIGLDGAGDDAALRVMREAETLARLKGAPRLHGRIPEVLDTFWVDDSYFLTTSALPGITLYEWTASNSPIYAFSSRTSHAYREAARSYSAKVDSIAKQLRDIVLQLGNAGVVHNDLQPSNILIDSDGSVSIVDFEAATNGQASGMRGVSWVYGSQRTFGLQADMDAITSLEAYAYWPPIVAAHLDPDWPARLHNHLRRYFPGKDQEMGRELPDKYPTCSDGLSTRPDLETVYAQAVCRFFETGRGLPKTERTKTGVAENRTIASFGKGLLATLSLRPVSNGVTVARRRFVERLAHGPSAQLRPHDLGFIDGVGLTAPLLHSSGHPAEAEAWVAAYADALRHLDPDQADWSIANGLAGHLLSILRMRAIGTRMAELEELASGISERLQERALAVLKQRSVEDRGGENMGLMMGASGVAVALHHYQLVTGIPSCLPQELIEWEVSRYRPVHNALFFVDSSRRFRPYLDRGNAGLLVAALVVLDPAELDQPRWLSVVEGMRTGVGVSPGLMTGAAGLLYAATAIHEADVISADTAGLVHDLRADLSDMLVQTADGPMAPGNLSRRVSLDGAHGAGGSTSVLARTLHGIFAFNQLPTVSHSAKEDAHA
ncbi:class III lanthionine synthetase LanKC N-terminal domain-containing protein [Auritidibacter ignavus]